MASNIYQGKMLRFKFADKKLLHATSCKITVASKLEEIATKDTDGTVVSPANYNFSGSTECLMANKPSGNSTHVTADDMLQYLMAGTEIDVAFSTSVTGDVIYTGKAYINNWDTGAETESSVKVSISFTGNGNLTRALVP